VEPEPVREPREGFTAVGQVIKAHGVRGEMRVRGFSVEAPHLQRGRWVWVEGERRRVRASRWDRDAWLLGLTGVESREAAEGLRGVLLEVPDAEVEREDEESYFVHELVGLRVMDVEGRELGVLREVLQPGANDVYVVEGPEGEVLLPAIGAVVERVDVAGGVVVVAWRSED
jgi:16S rRNA processing protein RimM